MFRRVAIIATLIILMAPPSRAAGDVPDYVFRGDPPMLDQARQYELQGTRIGRICRFSYPRLSVPTGTIWQVSDIAVDTKHCRKLVREGVPLTLAPAGIGTTIIRRVIGTSLPQSGSLRAPSSYARPLAQILSGQSDNWWTDQPGYVVHRDRTDVTWSFDGSCALGGSTSGYWEYKASTGWSVVYTGGDNTTYCSYHIGQTWSQFYNYGFCPWDITSTYHYVRFWGYANGAWSGDRSSENTTTCLPLYENFAVRGPA